MYLYTKINFKMLKLLEYIGEKILDAGIAIFFAFLGYFSPLKDVLHMALLFFLVDVIYGYLADRKLNKAKFQPRIIWKKTVPRVALTMVLLLLAYILDTETNQKWVNTYDIIGWLICGLLFVSILKNGYRITNWSVISIVEKWTKDKIKKETGINADGENI